MGEFARGPKQPAERNKLSSGVTTQVGDEKDCSKRPVPLRWTKGEMQQRCSERLVHVGDDLRICSGMAMPINIFPANEKFSLSPVNIPQVFIQAFCAWIIGVSHLESDLNASV